MRANTTVKSLIGQCNFYENHPGSPRPACSTLFYCWCESAHPLQVSRRSDCNMCFCVFLVIKLQTEQRAARLPLIKMQNEFAGRALQRQKAQVSRASIGMALMCVFINAHAVEINSISGQLRARCVSTHTICNFMTAQHCERRRTHYEPFCCINDNYYLTINKLIAFSLFSRNWSLPWAIHIGYDMIRTRNNDVICFFNDLILLSYNKTFRRELGKNIIHSCKINIIIEVSVWIALIITELRMENGLSNNV